MAKQIVYGGRFETLEAMRLCMRYADKIRELKGETVSEQYGKEITEASKRKVESEDDTLESYYLNSVEVEQLAQKYLV